MKWLDGKSAENKYVLEITFNNGSKGYLKNDSLEKINYYQSVLTNDKEVVSTEIIQSPLQKCA
jgi:hypothetical protein